MLQPNFNLLLWAILILNIISAVSNIILGAYEADKSQKYGVSDVLLGIAILIFIGYVLIS